MTIAIEASTRVGRPRLDAPPARRSFAAARAAGSIDLNIFVASVQSVLDVS
jgi:hypothetical protein